VRATACSLTAVLYMLIMDCQQRITVGGASCACVSQRDSIRLHNVGGRMGEFRLLYLLCMLRFPVPLHSLQPAAQLHHAAHTRQGSSAAPIKESDIARKCI
jgi:hypothetical protein